MKTTPGKTLDIWTSDSTVLHITEATLPIYTRKTFIVSAEKIIGVYIIQRILRMDYIVDGIYRGLKSKGEKLPRNFKKQLINEINNYFNE